MKSVRKRRWPWQSRRVCSLEEGGGSTLGWGALDTASTSEVPFVLTTQNTRCISSNHPICSPRSPRRRSCPRPLSFPSICTTQHSYIDRIGFAWDPSSRSWSSNMAPRGQTKNGRLVGTSMERTTARARKTGELNARRSPVDMAERTEGVVV